MRTPASPEISRVIVADVGGTNGRFAVAHYGAGETRLSDLQNFNNTELTGFADLLALYLEQLGESAPRQGCFATAGPNNGREGFLTNLGWSLDASALEQQFGLEEILFVNDFKALACMAPLLQESSSIPLNQVDAGATGPLTVMGPGTGLGVAIVLEHDDEIVTISTEGAHIVFAPVTPVELALRDYLAAEHEHVYVELLLSGAGLARIHDFLLKESGSGGSDLTPAEITSAALRGDDASCSRAVQVFLSILGSVAGDLALSHGALGGVYFGGGVLPRIIPLLEDSDLCERFCAKGVMEPYMRSIPIRLITEEHLALKGAAQLFWQHCQQRA